MSSKLYWSIRIKLVKSKKLGSNYKNPDGLVQVRVAKRMKLRGQEEPQAGQRVYYLVGNGKSKRICDRADNPDHVQDLDYDYYIDSQILKPLKRLLNVVNEKWKIELY
jgi:DNA polymerase elongation subunit (family B)